MALDKLASENLNITFIHWWPGAVNTGNVRKGWDANLIVGKIFSRVVESLNRLIGFSDDESG
ncbi:hypothetical protein QBC36DRAFT_369177 [Triangularia setosa]|uniref:Uncharacterized protein n=1 Tax=Triangularia setosa TaxID=2587417 RepID=A0AAN6VZF4_9PEZI|nr:hypothetical protein QBC36DRAFT_369177 [Podospora setosa]